MGGRRKPGMFETWGDARRWVLWPIVATFAVVGVVGTLGALVMFVKYTIGP